MKYYVFNVKTNKITVYESFQDLIQWCSLYNYETPYGMKNSLFDNLALNFNDKKVGYRWDKYIKDYVPYLEPREIIIFDENYKIIDIRLYKEEILKYPRNYFWINKSKKKETYEFRSGPVPHVRSKTKRRGKYYRHPHTTNERRASSDPEIQKFVRPKRRYNNLVNYWDEIPRHLDKSWKNKKIEKQWMKNLK